MPPSSLPCSHARHLQWERWSAAAMLCGRSGSRDGAAESKTMNNSGRIHTWAITLGPGVQHPQTATGSCLAFLLLHPLPKAGRSGSARTCWDIWRGQRRHIWARSLALPPAEKIRGPSCTTARAEQGLGSRWLCCRGTGGGTQKTNLFWLTQNLLKDELVIKAMDQCQQLHDSTYSRSMPHEHACSSWQPGVRGAQTSLASKFSISGLV